MVPVSGGTFNAKSMKVGVETNSEAGYRIMMSTLGNTNSLVNTDASKTEDKYKIPSITEDTIGTNFTGNAWGYAVGETGETALYKPVPSGSAIEIVNTDNSTAGQRDEYDLTFGAHIDTSLPAGDYGNTVLISAVANAEKITSLNQLTYMQDVTPEICANSPENMQKQLYDVRDGKKYWVSKMKDGHCWMIQNLALDIEGGKTYTAADTDLVGTETKTWTVPVDRGTETEIPAPTPGNNRDVRSWNLGKVLLMHPSSVQMCSDVEIPDDGNKYEQTNEGDIAYAGQNLVETCPEQYKNVEGWLDNFEATDADSFYENETTGIKSYDPRYLIGNFYQYGAATAGTGIGISGTASSNPDDLANAAGSICPKGWTLPKSGQDRANPQPWAIEGSFTNLLSKYSYSLDTGWQINSDNKSIFWSMNGKENLAVAPFYWVRTGRISVGLGRLNSRGVINLWSSTADTPMQAYMLFVGSTESSNVYPSYYSARYLAMPVRCISAK